MLLCDLSFIPDIFIISDFTTVGGARSGSSYMHGKLNRDVFASNKQLEEVHIYDCAWSVESFNMNFDFLPVLIYDACFVQLVYGSAKFYVKFMM